MNRISHNLCKSLLQPQSDMQFPFYFFTLNNKTNDKNVTITYSYRTIEKLRNEIWIWVFEGGTHL